MAFCDVLKRLRINADMTQGDLSKATGLTRSAIGMYESGSRQPKYEILEIFADFFNVDMNTLLDVQSSEDTCLSSSEVNLIARFRQLDQTAKDRISAQVDFELFRQNQNSQKEEKNLG